ncbi:MAG: HEPN domain-containing protein [Nanoarchaeota archaeon]|nr:HEPN domain-containing protein [Nanoarchaeota archaeon]
MVDNEEYDKWLKQAGADLRTAENSLKSEDYYASVFWCQQAVEKGLKALWLSKGNELIRTHDLIALGKKVGLPEKYYKVSAELSLLYTKVRYPVAEEFEKSSVDNFINFVGEVLEWIEKEM